MDERLATCGLRLTPQRQHVYAVLLGRRDHPTAEEIFLRAKGGMPEISMATVYNCLDALVQCGLAKQVNMDRGATRFCPNMREHSHFHCESCGVIMDVEPVRGRPASGWSVPRGFRVTHADVSLRGICRDCNERKRESESRTLA
jgi:Fur family peroxide stress response transcriptional regulator